MPRLSLYREKKSNDYRFFDRIIKEQFTVGGTDLYVHKYMGVKDLGPSADLTQPQRSILDPTQIQDLLFLENRDRNYAPDIYRIRGHYNVQNLDFDLSQFGLFLNNDTIFITIHYNEMIDLIGRKLMVGDVLELPHLTDYHPLNELIPTSLRRYYQVTDGNFASEGFSSTWYAHLWRIKCEPLVDSQEFSSILEQPLNKDNYLGVWDKTKTYVPGYVVTYGDKNYVTSDNVPIGTPCTIYDDVTKTYIVNSPFWTLDTADNLKDILSRYNTNIAINDAALAEAKRILPKSGYDNSNLYVVATDANDEPVSASSIVNLLGAPVRPQGTIEEIVARGQNYFVVKIGAGALKSIWDMTADSDDTKLAEFVKMNLKVARSKPKQTDGGSGKVKGDLVLSVKALGAVDGPYGTTDNTYSEADQDPVVDGFTGTIIPDIMDYRADSDPRFHYVARSSPRSFGYSGGYMVGGGSAPNGIPTGAGITFPSQPKLGDYFLRTDYLPQLLFRWDGSLWVKISENVRTGVGFSDANNQSQLSGFINNTNLTTLSDGTTMPERQALSQILKIQPD
jgi:hypothetical protein